MKTVIQKRADRLQPGDIISYPDQRSIVLSVKHSPMSVRIVALVIDVAHKLIDRDVSPGVEIMTEVDQLTPAQRHADELVESLLAAANILRGGNLSAQEHERKIRTLLAKLEPIEPPTLQEALGALMKLADGAGAVMAGTWEKDSMQPERTAAHDIIRRARAAGVLK